MPFGETEDGDLMRVLTLLAAFSGSVINFAACSAPSSLVVAPDDPEDLPDETGPMPRNALVYASGTELWIAEPKSAPRTLAALDGAVQFPSVSPDGRRVAFSTVGARGTWVMQVLNADGSRVQLTPEGSHDIAPSWSPDGSRIAFLSRHPDDGDEIYVMNADGTGRVRLTRGPLQMPGIPAWSPDGSRIAYAWVDVSPELPSTGIYVVRPDGTAPVRISPLMAPVPDLQRPAWSPDGRRLAYLDLLEGAVWLLDADGSNSERLPLGMWAANLAWSPDGEHIAFNELCPGYGDCSMSIWVVHVADGRVARLVPPFADAPSWVP
jgi:Tol biopolymer transport system component